MTRKKTTKRPNTIKADDLTKESVLEALARASRPLNLQELADLLHPAEQGELTAILNQKPLWNAG